MGLCPAKKLMAGLLSRVEQGDLRLPCASVRPGSAAVHYGKRGWRVALPGSNREFSCKLPPRAALGCRCELYAGAAPKRGARALLGSLGCGTSEWETQAGLVSKGIFLSDVQDNVLGLWWWPRRSVG